MKHQLTKLGAGVAVAALLAAGCGSDGDSADSADSTSSTVAARSDAHEMTATDGGAAELRAGLTSLLQEHVYLAGAAIASAVRDGGDLDAPATAAAVGALDENSVALSEAIESVYGEDAGAQFLELWRNHIGFFVDYTLGGATGDAAKQADAKAKLDAYRADFGAFVASATDGNLAADTVAENLQVHVDTLIDAVDAVLAGSPDVYPKLKMAAGHMPSTAAALAGAIATQKPDDVPGDPASPASELRSSLTHLLQEHVYLAGLAIDRAVLDGGDLDAPGTAAAVGALDENSVALSEAIESVYGEDAGAQFLELWRNHIGFFVDYTLGGATGDAAKQADAKAKLDAYRADFGAFVASATDGNLAADTVADNLQVHVDTLIDAIDAVLAGDADVIPQLRTAARHMPSTAAALTGAIVAQYPDRFPA